MSQYANFYINKGMDYICIGSYSRNSSVYEYFHRYIPYENGEEITVDTLESIVNNIDSAIVEYKEKIEELKRDKEYIATCNNSLEEKMSLCQDIAHDIDEYIDSIESLKVVKHYAYFLRDIIEDADYMDNTSGMKIKVIGGVEYCPMYDNER